MHKLYISLLIILGSLIFLRLPATYFTFVVALFVIVNYKEHTFKKNIGTYLLIIASPFLLDIIFSWNNDSISEAVKVAEKRFLLFLLPLIILSYPKILPVYNILKYYARISILLILILWISFGLESPLLFQKYFKGEDLWQMGYSFANYFDSHAPALNMHVSFILVNHLYFFFDSISKRQITQSVLNLLFLSLSIFFLLYLNTRIAIINALFFGTILIVYESFKKKSLKHMVGFLSVAGMIFFIGFEAFTHKFPFIKEKFTEVAFRHMDKRGKLDELESPETTVFNSLVLRLSIWDCAYELAQNSLPYGTGAANGKKELVAFYEEENHNFLAKYKFPVHNQHLDMFVKYGYIGLFVGVFFMAYLFYIGFKLRNGIPIAFAGIFFISNLTDDFLIRFDGIAFVAFWISLFTHYYLNQIEPRRTLKISNQ